MFLETKLKTKQQPLCAMVKVGSLCAEMKYIKNQLRQNKRDNLMLIKMEVSNSWQLTKA
ncbi:hypothetical protein D3C87_1935940 [compost metagenome]